LSILPDSAKDLQLLLVNGAGLLAGVAVQYYFGSSAGSAAKDRALNQQQGKQP
jgi:F0F1-type ATP synthase membrane subunit c/vacuolar-type H+-ATPase subunit K